MLQQFEWRHNGIIQLLMPLRKHALDRLGRTDHIIDVINLKRDLTNFDDFIAAFTGRTNHCPVANPSPERFNRYIDIIIEVLSGHRTADRRG